MEYTWITRQIEVLVEQRAKMHREMVVQSSDLNRSIREEAARLLQHAGAPEVVADLEEAAGVYPACTRSQVDGVTCS